MIALLFSDVLLAIGIRVQGGGFSSMVVTDIDKHTEKGFQASRLAITDRWGMYREFDESGTQLHARVCHRMRTRKGCPKYLEFHLCGCACPYMHARSSEIGQWLVASARGLEVKPLTPWHRGLAHKDAAGRLLSRGLPYIDGLCVGPKRWREELDPDHVRPTKHKRQTRAEELVTIDAFEPQTIREVSAIRTQVQASFDEMQRFW